MWGNQLVPQLLLKQSDTLLAPKKIDAKILIFDKMIAF